MDTQRHGTDRIRWIGEETLIPLSHHFMGPLQQPGAAACERDSCSMLCLSIRTHESLFPAPIPDRGEAVMRLATTG